MQTQEIVVKNKQKSISRLLLLLVFVCAAFWILPFISGNILSGIWPLAFLAFFLDVVFLATALIFRSRSRKMDELFSNKELLMRWTLSDEMLEAYAAHQKRKSREKNQAIMKVFGILFTVITVPFLFFLEKDELMPFLFILFSIFGVVFLFSVLMPVYYYRLNLKSDKQILIGKKYAYINGIFHNWDFPLSGLKKVKVMRNPFYGLSFTYYYTDRTWKNSEELEIPAPATINLNLLAEQLRANN